MKGNEGLGDVGEEAVVVVEHPQKLLKGLDGVGSREGGDGLDFVRQWRQTCSTHAVAEEVNLIDAKNALGTFDHESMLLEAAEEGAEVGLVLLRGLTGDEDVV